MTRGIYKIQNTIDGRMYVGQSVDIESRLKEHFRVLNLGTHGNKFLQRSFAKYGQHAFVSEVVEEIPDGDLTEYEQYYMDLNKSMSKSGGDKWASKNTGIRNQKNHPQV